MVMGNIGIYHTRYHTQYALYSIQVVAGAIAQAFGPVYFSVNFGLMFTSALVLYGSLIIVTQVDIIYNIYHIYTIYDQVDILYDTIGDTGMFIAAGVVGAVGAVSTLFVPADIRYVRRNKK